MIPNDAIHRFGEGEGAVGATHTPPAPPVTEKVDGEWVKGVAQILEAFKTGSADLKTASDNILSLQKQRGDHMEDGVKVKGRSRVMDGATPEGSYNARDQAALMHHLGYDEAMEEPAARGSWLHEVQRLNDQVRDIDLYHNAMRMKAQALGEVYTGSVKTSKKLARLKAMVTKAADDFWSVDNAGQGAEWKPTVYSTQVIPFFRLPTGIAANFPLRQIPRGLAIWREPVITARASIKAAAEFTDSSEPVMFPVAADLSTPGTGYLELAPKYKFTGATACSVEAEEDLIVSTIAVHREALMFAHAEAMDSAIINGDNTLFLQSSANAMDGTDRPNVGAGIANEVFCGLRQYIFFSDQVATGATARGTAFQTAAQAGKLTASAVHAARTAMAKYGAVSPSRLRLFVDPIGYLGLVGDPVVKTIDVYGPQATIVAGELGRIWGIPIVASEWVPSTLAASGRNNAGAGTASTAILTLPERWLLGIKRDLQINLIPAINSDALYLKSFLRAAFNQAPPTTDKHTYGIPDVRAS